MGVSFHTLNLVSIFILHPVKVFIDTPLEKCKDQIMIKLNTDKVKRELVVQGWTQQDLAKHLGVTRQAVNSMLRRQSAGLKLLNRVAELLGVDPKDLLI